VKVFIVMEVSVRDRSALNNITISQPISNLPQNVLDVQAMDNLQNQLNDVEHFRRLNSSIPSIPSKYTIEDRLKLF